MKKSTRYIVHGAVIAALYVVLTYLQNFLIPDSATWAVQFRASEALCVLAFFTPAAIPGLTIGCLLFNLSYAGALPLDFVVGALASCLAALTMWYTRKVTVKGYPLLGMVMPALFNAILVGWELACTVFTDDAVLFGASNFTLGAFGFNAVLVALGELGVLLTLGSLLYYAIKARKLDQKLFGVQ